MMRRAMVNCYLKLEELKNRRKNLGYRLVREECGGAEIIAAIILVAIVVMLAVVFKDKIQKMLTEIWGGIDEKTKELGKDITLG